MWKVLCAAGLFLFAGCTGARRGADGAAVPAGAEAAGIASGGAGGRVILGDEQFDEYVPLLAGRRVAVFSNHSGIVGDRVTVEGAAGPGGSPGAEPVPADLVPFGRTADGRPVAYGEHVLDALLARGVDVAAIFSPEHGFRGDADAGAAVSDSVDSRTGVPILSLYADAAAHSPSAQGMAMFDVLVVDVQDVGLRYYTYYISLFYLMDACARWGKPVVLLDRPNPNGFYVDGPVLREEFASGVGRLPIPVVHGMTWGELARMINGEGWLPSGGECPLTVIPCRNYTHRTKYALVRAPSPNLKDMRAVYLYASTCFFENTLVSVGRGTDFPFEAFGSPYLRGAEGYGFSFTPAGMPGAAEPPFKGVECFGRDLRGRPLADIWGEQIHLDYLADAYGACAVEDKEARFFGPPDARGRYWLDLLCGTDAVRRQIAAGVAAEDIRAGWQDEVAAFRERRRPYLLYAE